MILFQLFFLIFSRAIDGESTTSGKFDTQIDNALTLLKISKSYADLQSYRDGMEYNAFEQKLLLSFISTSSL